MTLAVLLFAPPATIPTLPVPAAMIFAVTPALDTPAPAISVSAQMVLEANSDSVVPSADPSFHCISRPALWFLADRPDWEATPGVGVVLSSAYVSRGTVTRSGNG